MPENADGIVQILEEAFEGIEVSLVSRDNYLLYTPMLAEVATGQINPFHIAAPLRVFLRRVRVSPSDGPVFTVGADGLLKTWDPFTGKEAAPPVILRPAPGGPPRSA